jgi:hypothetical protein
MQATMRVRQLQQTANQFTTGMISQNGPMGDIAYFAVRQLRDNPELVKRLRDELGIDINTPLGVMRAAQRAPELAARGIPQVGRAIRQRFHEAFPERGMRKLVALNMTNGDAEKANFLANEDVEGVYQPAPVKQPAAAAAWFKGTAKTRLTDERDRGMDAALKAVGEVTVIPEVIELTAKAWGEMGQNIRDFANTSKEFIKDGFDSIGDIVKEAVDRDMPTRHEAAH